MSDAEKLEAMRKLIQELRDRCDDAELKGDGRVSTASLRPIYQRALEGLSMTAQHTPGAEYGVAISLRIGQRVRHQDYQGQRVTGVVQGLSVEDRALMVDIALDAPIVIPAIGEYGPTNIYRQHVPAHELAPFDEREELIAGLLDVVREMVEMMDRGDEHGAGSEWHAKAIAAIAKATGSTA